MRIEARVLVRGLELIGLRLIMFRVSGFQGGYRVEGFGYRILNKGSVFDCVLLFSYCEEP